MALSGRIFIIPREEEEGRKEGRKERKKERKKVGGGKMSLKRNKALFDLLMQIPDVTDRSNAVKHLRSDCAHDLCSHLQKLIYQQPSHRLRSEKHRKALKQAMQPHSAYLKRVFKQHRKQGKRDFKLPGGQKGAGIFSLIAAAVIPILVDLISKATRR